MGRARRLASAVSLLASAGGFAWLSVQYGTEWRGLAFSGGLAAASYALTRKNLYAQIMARGLAWVVFAPCAFVMAIELLKGHLFEPALTGFGLTSGLALLLARPMLDTEEARAAFAPTKMRRSFLAACTAAVTTGLVTGMVAFEMLTHSFSSVVGGLGLAALGTSMIASAFGVLRMRGWGVALAVLNAIISLTAGALTGHEEGIALAATALPGVLFLLPIVAAKLGVGEGASSRTASMTGTQTRIAEDEAQALPSRVRIAANDIDDDRFADLDVAEAAPARPRAARVA